MTWVIAIAGFCALIVLHEAGHFFAAKAVGMRVERFSLFFPPRLFGFRIGETDYQIGALPLGGYVKITGMTPDELSTVDLRVSERTYYMKAPLRLPDSSTAANSANAVTRLTAGPARITTTRFHGAFM